MEPATLTVLPIPAESLDSNWPKLKCAVAKKSKVQMYISSSLKKCKSEDGVRYVIKLLSEKVPDICKIV